VTYAFDPELAAAVARLPESPIDDIPAARTAFRDLLSAFPAPSDEGVEWRVEHVPGPPDAGPVRLLVYRPAGVTEPVGAIYDIHGGGYILGDPEMMHPANLALCRTLGVVVVSVDYRLAPEHRYPAAIDDCYAGLEWLAGNAESLGVDPTRIVVKGESAGGGLAAALSLIARDRGGPAIAFTYLGIPELDDRLETPSMRAFVDTPLWSRPRAELSWASYLGPGVPGSADVSPYAAPARATDLRGLPPAYISAMEFDPLRDEAIVYATGLLAAGVSVELHVYPGTFHGSAIVPTAAVSKRQYAEEYAVLRRTLRVE
jgi:acetyl esterase/lipase